MLHDNDYALSDRECPELRGKWRLPCTPLYDTFLRLATSGLGGANASNSLMSAGISL
jgi:hypothetical protein